jgi:hypothetical protein
MIGPNACMFLFDRSSIDGEQYVGDQDQYLDDQQEYFEQGKYSMGLSLLSYSH